MRAALRCLESRRCRTSGQCRRFGVCANWLKRACRSTRSPQRCGGRRLPSRIKLASTPFHCATRVRFAAEPASVVQRRATRVCAPDESARSASDRAKLRDQLRLAELDANPVSGPHWKVAPSCGNAALSGAHTVFGRPSVRVITQPPGWFRKRRCAHSSSDLHSNDQTGRNLRGSRPSRRDTVHQHATVCDVGCDRRMLRRAAQSHGADSFPRPLSVAHGYRMGPLECLWRCGTYGTFAPRCTKRN